MAVIATYGLRLAGLALATAIALEIVLQLAFPRLPAELIQRMPQYQERAGFRLQTEHGAREYPAGETVNIQVNQYAGDLYRLTCLKTEQSQFFEPYQVSYTRDQRGFRNAWPWPETVDLVVVGDSFTAGELVQRPFWQEVADSVFSLGLPGSGTFVQGPLLEAYGLPRNPDTVALAFFGGNDLTDNQVSLDAQRAGETLADRVHRRSPLEYLATVHLVIYLRDTLVKAQITDCHYPQLARASTPTPIAFFDAMLPILADDVDALRDSEMYQETAAFILDLALRLRERGIRFIFMYIPQKAELYWQYLDILSQTIIVDALQNQGEGVTVGMIAANVATQRDLWASFAEQNSIEFLDITPALHAAIEKGASPYFFADTHWNQLGHDIAREALREFLQ